MSQALWGSKDRKWTRADLRGLAEWMELEYPGESVAWVLRGPEVVRRVPPRLRGRIGWRPERT